jgi:GNAT superfamily N-acetyltransferase
MTQTFSVPQVVCRPALARDHADINEFCKGIWSGHDYVPEVWDHWFHDPHGILAVAEYHGRAIGCSKISLISEGQWWLEGFRVDPKYQGLKVGSHIHNYITDWWQAHGDGTLRLMTSAENTAVHHLCQKTGYVKTHEVCGYVAGPIDASPASFFPTNDTSEAAAFTIQSESLKLTDQLIDFGWRIGTPNEQVFDKYSGYKADFVHTFYWWKNKQGLFSAWEDDENGKRTLFLGVLACRLEDMPALLVDIRSLATRKNFDSVFQIAFVIPKVILQLERAGFVKDWEHNAFVFEKKHPVC